MELSTPLPPEELIFVVHGHRDPQIFAEHRQPAVGDILRLLAEGFIDYRSFNSILDFGCGCGRILAGWEGVLGADTFLAGVDLNPALVEFCQQNIRFAEVSRCSAYPPLAFPDARFDFVYAASVYTHMKLPAMLCWTGELARITRPGGIVMMSYHGTYYAAEAARLSVEGSRQLEERGYFVYLHVPQSETYEGSNHYTSFHNSAFIRSLFQGFELVHLSPGVAREPNSFAYYQDVAIFRRLAD
jgi:SAM-dependent methyltransferase